MVHVAVLDGLEVVYVERLESHHLLPVFRTVGHRLPAHWTSRRARCCSPRSRGTSWSGGCKAWRLERVTRHTITDHEALFAELEGVAKRAGPRTSRRATSASCRSERPLRGADGKVIAAVTVVGSSERISTESLRRYRVACSRPPR